MAITERQRKLNDERVKEDIRDFGCHVIGVVDPDAKQPSFTYSVGIQESASAPEAIVLGLPTALGAGLINEYKRQVQSGRRFLRGTPYRGFLENHSVYFEPVRSKVAVKYTLGCTRYYGEDGYALVQIVYPTTDGVWPWQHGASECFIANQPMLGRVRPDRS
jgi:hypothetical protein